MTIPKTLPKIAAYVLARQARFRGPFATTIPGPILECLIGAGLVERTTGPHAQETWHALTDAGRRAVLVWGEKDGRRYAERGEWILKALQTDGYALEAWQVVAVVDRQPCQVRSRVIAPSDWRNTRALLAERVLA